MNNEKNDMIVEKEQSNEKQGFWKKASSFGKKVAEKVQVKAHEYNEKVKDENYRRMMEKYNPVTLEELRGEKFYIPNIIEIIDDATVRDIEVLQGTVAHREKINGVEVLHLYDEFIKESNITFVPFAKCDNVYCVDPFDRTRFINIDCVFAKTHEEKLAELEQIAHCLGAKSCSIELVEGDNHLTTKKTNASTGNMSISNEGANVGLNSRSGKTTTFFTGNDTPHRPNLKWFAHDDNINLLIDMRCSNDNTVKSRAIELSGASCATMTKKLAGSIDKILKVKSAVSMESKIEKENNSVLIFEIEF